MATEKVNVINIDAEEAKTTLKDLRKELLALKNEMTNLDADSDAFKQMANKAGEVKHAIDEINESVKGASSDIGDMIGNSTSAVAGLVGAFQTVEGALQMMGVESEAVGEAIVRMQGLMAMTQGLASIDDGIKAFGKLKTAVSVATVGMNSFKKALLGTGIGALVVALGTLIAYWDDVSSALGIYNENAEKNKQLLEEQKTAVDNLSSAIAKQRKLAKLNDKDELESEKEILSQLNQQLDKEKQRIKYFEGIINTRRKLTEEQQESYQTALANETKLNDLILDQQLKIKDLEDKINSTTTDTTEQKRKIDLYEELLAKIAKYNEETEKGYIHTNEEQRQYNSWLEEEIRLKKEIIDVNWLLQKRAEEYAEANKEMVGELKNNLQLLAETKIEPIDVAEAWKNSPYNNFKQVQNDVENVGKTTYETYSAIVGQMGYLASTFNSMLSTLASQQDATTEEGFRRQKNMNIAAATVNGLMGILNAWVSAMSPTNAWMTLPGQIALGAVQSAFMGTIMGIQIDAIKRQKLGSNSASVSSVNPASVMSLNTPQLTQDVNGASIEDSINKQKNTKVYVLESDITNTQNKVHVARSENVY